MTPKDVLKLAKENKAMMVDSSSWIFQGCGSTFPYRGRTDGRHFRRRPRVRRFKHPRMAVHPHERHARGARCDNSGDGPLHEICDALADLQYRGPDHQGALLTRPALHRAEGRRRTSSPPASATPAIWVRSRNSSSSTTCDSTRTPMKATTTSTARKASGTRAALRTRTWLQAAP